MAEPLQDRLRASLVESLRKSFSKDVGDAFEFFARGLGYSAMVRYAPAFPFVLKILSRTVDFVAAEEGAVAKLIEGRRPASLPKEVVPESVVEDSANIGSAIAVRLMEMIQRHEMEVNSPGAVAEVDAAAQALYAFCIASTTDDDDDEDDDGTA